MVLEVPMRWSVRRRMVLEVLHHMESFSGHRTLGPRHHMVTVARQARSWASSQATTWAADSSGVWPAVSMRSSGASGGS